MSFTIDTAQEQPINLAPQTLYEEVIQNVWFLLSSLEYDIPLNREFGLNALTQINRYNSNGTCNGRYFRQNQENMSRDQRL